MRKKMKRKSMYKYIWKISLWCLVFFHGGILQGQEAETDSVPKIKKKEPLTLDGVRIGTDIVLPVIEWADHNFREYEVSMEALLGNRWLLVGDVGRASITRSLLDEYSYKSEGIFLRIGADYNLWQKDPQHVGGLFMLGMRYGFANFKHSLSDYTLTSPYWNATTGTGFEENSLNGHWVELNARLQIKVLKHFYMGPMMRMKIRLAMKSSDTLGEVNDIPGYGLNIGAKMRIGYQILYHLPLRK